jgi:hypothetical protein
MLWAKLGKLRGQATAQVAALEEQVLQHSKGDELRGQAPAQFVVFKVQVD